ncbi:MAG: hypothetical protein JSU94_10545 [Phycisphaerales bacterium]|nr:MAG: hypothetical protein JSU94_10545 [Phycisphaerales bacterium]
MAIEAPVSKFKKTNLKIYIAILIALALIFAYDGYLSKYKWSMRYGFYKKHVLENDGKPTSTMQFNRKSPPFFAGAGALLLVYLLAIGGKKITADENELALSRKVRIDYDSIQKIDKTHFDTRGFFVITYKDKNGGEVNRRLSKRAHDNLEAVLDHLVAKIS